MSLSDPQKKTDADKIQADWSLSHSPSEAEVKRAALLASEGYLTSLKCMEIGDINITDIPRDQMEKLASIVTWRVWIDNISHADQLSSILASVQCQELGLWRMELSEAETQALVTAMRDRVQWVGLWNVTLDMEELTQYDGQGLCSVLYVGGDDTRTRYRTRLRRWAADMGWTVTWDNGVLGLVMKRK